MYRAKGVKLNDMKTEIFEFNGYQATVIFPQKPNGKWIWKTEFLYAYDESERALLDRGYTRVYYSISDKYGSNKAVRLMHAFHRFLIKKYPLQEKPCLFGFSRGGLYAFNYALYYPELVDKIYLDAPVLDVKTWPLPKSIEQAQLFEEYCLAENTFEKFANSPVDNFKEFFESERKLLVVAGGADKLVPYEQNAGRLVKYCQENGIKIDFYFKPDCGHHPHSLQDVTPIVEFIERADD